MDKIIPILIGCGLIFASAWHLSNYVYLSDHKAEIGQTDSLKKVIENMGWHRVDTMILGGACNPDTVLLYKIGKQTK